MGGSEKVKKAGCQLMQEEQGGIFGGPLWRDLIR